MPYFPFFINIENEPFLVVGAGKVAARKIEKLLPFKPSITVVSDKISEEVHRFAENETVVLKRRTFTQSDLDSVRYVITASNNKKLNYEIAKMCRKKGILCNSVDDPENCSFFFPALSVKGDITAAVSTSGKSPVLAAELRKKIDKIVDDKTAEICDVMGQVRSYIKENFLTEAERKEAAILAIGFCKKSKEVPDRKRLENFLNLFLKEKVK